MRATATKIVVGLVMMIAIIAIPVMSVASSAPTAQASAAPNGYHPDTTDETVYCPPGTHLVGTHCYRNVYPNNNPTNGDWVAAGMGVMFLVGLLLV